jgi:hypothetical protein
MLFARAKGASLPESKELGVVADAEGAQKTGPLLTGKILL